MKQILVTGATGNIGFATIKYFIEQDSPGKIIAGVRDIRKARKIFKDFPSLEYVPFDFNDTETFEPAIERIDTMFLLRPPHLSEVEKYFKPLISRLKEKKVKEIIFLSVQGAEKSRIIPHHKIEKLIREHALDYIFLRPGYFMQNLTTTLLEDIQTNRKITLPAGRAKFNWIDIENIGETCAILLHRFSDFKNQAIEITGYENKNFYQVVRIINSIINNPIQYQNVNPLKFYRMKKRSGMPQGMIIVMFLLHFIPGFQKEPEISYFYEQLTGKKPTGLKQFIEREREKFETKTPT
ncbi:MAG: NmrA family NAD(P)-binding protein [Bacteroidales bacterium]|jgi:uncharacterized protein YbjT (DUF2867 family)|nr:NmrA family NAD(P)-binding protein [Bacteroidales bacterium]